MYEEFTRIVVRQIPWKYLGNFGESPSDYTNLAGSNLVEHGIDCSELYETIPT